MATAKFAITQRQIDVDALGALRERIDVLQLAEQKLTQRLQRRSGKTSGMVYAFNAYDSSNRTFDYTRAERLLGDAAYNRCWTTNEFRTSRLTKIKKG
jgi:hypothetical protein